MVGERDAFGDLGDCTAAQLSDAIGQLHALAVCVLRQMLRVIAEYDRREAWRPDGAMSMDAWLAASLGVLRSTGFQWAEVGAKLEDLPAIDEVFARGELSFDQVRSLCRFATSETDEALAEEAVGRSAGELQAAARRARPVDATKEREESDRRSLRMWWDTEKAVLHLRGRLPGVDGAKVEKAISFLTDRIPKEPEQGLHLSAEVRQADALTEMSGYALAEQRDPDRATVVVHADLPALTGDGTGRCEVEHGPLLSVETARRLGCDGRIQTVFHGDGDEPVGVGRTLRTVPPWLGRLLRKRDTTCRFPGCNRRGALQAHHIVHWTQGGPTDTGNLCLLCGFHHHYLHERRWTIEGDPKEKLVFRRPDGRVFGKGPPRLRRSWLPG